MIAIAITLLVIDLQVPDLAPAGTGGLLDRLMDASPHVLTFALSFAVVGRWWFSHHRLHQDLGDVDVVLVALTSS